MPEQPIPFVPDQQGGLSERAGASPVAANVVIDGRGAVRRRPGIALFGQLIDSIQSGETGAPVSIPTTNDVEGIHVTLDGSVYAVEKRVPSRRIHRLAPGETTFVNMSASGTFGTRAEWSLPGLRRPTFAETEAMLVIAGGAQPRRVLFSPLGISPLGGSPPQASHIIAHGARLVANDVIVNQSQFFYSDQAIGSSTTGHETWSGAGTGFITAESRPDKILAIHESTNELFVFGQTTLQVYAPDLFFVYSALPTINHGVAGAYGIVAHEGAFAWLDHRRRFVLSAGRGVEYIGEQIQQTLDDMASVSDVFGYRVRLGPVDCLVWTFPSDGRTFAYQVGGGWAEWLGWTSNHWSQFIVRSHHQSGSTNWVGLTGGRIGKLSNTTSTDLDSPINAYVQTGFLDRETSRRKRTIGVRLSLKRGETTSAAEPHAWLRWKDRPGAWAGECKVRLGASGDREVVVPLRSLGVYRTRQWMFEFAGSEDLELARATEEFEVLDN